MATLTHLTSASITASVSVDTKTSRMCGTFRCAMAMYLLSGCRSTYTIHTYIHTYTVFR